jgi:CheY-like chemotaxis protein
MTEPAGGRPSRPRLVLADDHPSALAAAVRLLGGEFDIAAIASDGAAALALLTRLGPDGAVLDISKGRGTSATTTAA